MFDPVALSSHEISKVCRENKPFVFLVLGSGFAEVAASFSVIQSWPFASIPGMHPSTVLGHKGMLTLAHKKGINILISEGRIHFYEGYSPSEVCALVQIGSALGCKIAILTNAAGGIHPNLHPGAMMVLENHIVMPGSSWNADKDHPGISPKKNSPYSSRLIQLASESLKENKIQHMVGNYLMVTGPCYETPAEIRAFQRLRADAVGMSTAWEAEESQRLGMECLGISGISNKAAGLSPEKLNHEEIVGNARQIGKSLENLINGILEKL